MNHIETLRNSIIRLLKAILYRSRVILSKFLFFILKILKFLWKRFCKFISKEAHKHPGGTFSIILHIIIILLLIGDLSTLFHKPPEQTETISVQMKLPISDITNVKPKKTENKNPKKEKKPVKPKPEKKPVKKDIPKKKEIIKKPVITKPVSKPTTKPVKKDAPKKKEVIKKKTYKFIPKPSNKPRKPVKKPKKEPKKEPVKKVKKPLLKDLTKPEASDKKTEKENNAPEFDPTLPLSMSEKDAIKYQITECWIPPIGGKEMENIIIEVKIKYFKDGRLNGKPELLNKNSSNYYRTISDSVLRAIYKCNPLKDLPVEKYSRWKEIEFEFSTKEAF